MSTKCCKYVWCTCGADCKKEPHKCKLECEVYHYVCQRGNFCRCSRHEKSQNIGICHKLHDLLRNVRNICQELLHYPKGKLSLYKSNYKVLLLFIIQEDVNKQIIGTRIEFCICVRRNCANGIYSIIYTIE